MHVLQALALGLTLVLSVLHPRLAWASDPASAPKAFSTDRLVSQQSPNTNTPMLINYGIGGSWINPFATSQGLVLEVIPALNALTAYWFTFGQDGESREWFIAVGDINGNSATMTIYRVEGGVFEQATLTEEIPWGTALLSFSGCRNARFEFESIVDGISGAYDLVRLTPDAACAASLADAHTTFVTRQNRWIDGLGTWVFDTCVNLGPNESHGREEFVFEPQRLSFDIQRFNASDCQGPSYIQSLSFDLVRVDKTMAMLDGQTVIANRVLLTNRLNGQLVRQTLYFDDRQATPLMTHGVLEGPFDGLGFPAALHSIFASPLTD